MNNQDQPGSINQDDIIHLLIDFIHRLGVHYGMWFAEVVHHLGWEKAYQILSQVYPKSRDIQIKRLAEALGQELDAAIPKDLKKMSVERLEKILKGVAINWLAQDGVWFQGVESSQGMDMAKLCNDSCWARFSPFEAWSVKELLKLEHLPGLEGLKKALGYRLYAMINKQSIVEETETSFVFQMNECRVQEARKRKGLADYPCKSGGVIEYTTFATGIDERIKTECLACPPDFHPPGFFCAWRFYL